MVGTLVTGEKVGTLVGGVGDRVFGKRVGIIVVTGATGVMDQTTKPIVTTSITTLKVAIVKKYVTPGLLRFNLIVKFVAIRRIFILNLNISHYCNYNTGNYPYNANSTAPILTDPPARSGLFVFTPY